MNIQTKFDPDQDVWVMHENKAKMLSVVAVHAIAAKETKPNCVAKEHFVISITYSIRLSGSDWFPAEEQDVYATKEELLASL